MNVAEQDKNRSRSHQRLIYTKGERCKKKEKKENKKIMEKKNRSKQNQTTVLRHGESNPGLPRDRRGY